MSIDLETVKTAVPDIYKAQAVNIQNISQMFWLGERWYHDLKEYVLLPPFNNFFTYWESPKYAYSKSRGSEEFPNISVGSGMLTHFRVLEEGDDHFAMFYASGESREIVTERDMDFNPDAFRTMLITMFVFHSQEKHVMSHAQWILEVDQMGKVLEGGFRYMVQPNQKTNESAIPLSFLFPSAMAISFANCKNVETTSTDAKPKSKKRRRRSRRGWWSGKWHRIKVKPIIVKAKPREPGQPTGIKLAKHNRIGHFRHYGPEFGRGKLFGKYSGVFWIEEKIVGDDQIGTVEKEYHS